MPLTVSEIAKRTGHGASNRFIERLHYWTRERLLLPIGKRNPGVGKRRVYPDDTAVQDAVILNAMMEAAVPTEAQKMIMGTVRQHRHLEWWMNDAKPFFLVIEAHPGGYGHPYFQEGPDFKIQEFAKQTIIFNLKQLLTDLPSDTLGSWEAAAERAAGDTLKRSKAIKRKATKREKTNG